MDPGLEEEEHGLISSTGTEQVEEEGEEKERKKISYLFQEGLVEEEEEEGELHQPEPRPGYILGRRILVFVLLSSVQR